MKLKTRIIETSLPNISKFAVFYANLVSKELPGQRGWSHLAEHLLCKSYDHSRERYDSKAIAYNASTGYEGVTFYFRGLTDQLLPELTDLCNHAESNFFSFIPSKSKFDTEKQVVLQEYDMYMNQQDFAVDINVLRKHFGVYHAIGLRQDIENADYEAFIDFIRASFKVPYDVLLVTDYSAESQMLADSIDKRFDHFDKSDLDYTEVNRVTPNPFYVPEFYGSTSTETTIMDWMQIEGIDRWKSKLIAELWSRGMSPLFKEIRESRGLSYCPLIFDLNQSIGGIQTFVKTAPENVDMVRSVIADMFSYRWQEFITPERVKAVKDSLMCSHLMLSKDNTQINHTITHSLYGTPIKPSIEMIDSVSYDEIWDIHDRIISKTRFVEASGGQGVIV